MINAEAALEAEGEIISHRKQRTSGPVRLHLCVIQLCVCVFRHCCMCDKHIAVEEREGENPAADGEKA